MHLTLHSARIVLLLYGLGASCSFPQGCEKGTSCANIEKDKSSHQTHRLVRRTPASQLQTSWTRLSVSEQVEFYRSVSTGADIFQDFFTRRERVRDDGHGPNSVRNTYTWITGKMNEIFQSDVVNYPGYLEGYFHRPNVVNTINATEAVRYNAPERSRGNEHHPTSSSRMKAFVTPIEMYPNQVGLTFREPKDTYFSNPESIDTAHVLMQAWRILRPPSSSPDSKYPIWIEVDQVLDHERDLYTDGEIVKSILKVWKHQHPPESISFSLHSASEDEMLSFYALLSIPPCKEVMNMLATYGHELGYPTIQRVSIMKNTALGDLIPRMRLHLSQAQYSPENFRNMIVRHTRAMLNRFYELQSRVNQNEIPEVLQGQPSLPYFQNTPAPPNPPPLPQTQPQGNFGPPTPQQPIPSRRSSSELMPPPPSPEHRKQQPPRISYGYTYGMKPPPPNPVRRVPPTRPRSFPVPSSEFTASFTDMLAPGAAPQHPQPDTSSGFRTSRHSSHSTPSRTHQTSAPPKSEPPLKEKYRKLQKSLDDPSAGFNLPSAETMKGMSHIGGWYQADKHKSVRTTKSTSSLKPPSQSKHVRFASDTSTKDPSSQQPTSGHFSSRPSGGMSTSRSFDELRTTGRISGDPALPQSPRTVSSKRSRDDLSPERSGDILSTKRSRENLSAHRSFGDIPESPFEEDLYSLPPGSGAFQSQHLGNMGPIGRQSGDMTTEGALSADLRPSYQPQQQAAPMGRSFSERMAKFESLGRRVEDSPSMDTLPRANFPRPPSLTSAAALGVDSLGRRVDEHRHRTAPGSGISNTPALQMPGVLPSGTLSSRPFATTENSASQAPSENIVHPSPRRRVPVQEYYIDPNDPEDPEVIEEAYRVAEEQRLPIAFPPRRGHQHSRFQPSRTPSASQTGSSSHRPPSESDDSSGPAQPSTTTRPSASS